MGIQQLEDIFSFVHMNLHSWLHISGLGANDVTSEWHKQGDFYVLTILAPKAI
jgi:hypothetical protein